MTRNRYSPSSLRVYAEQCPKALDFYQERREEITEGFDVGNAAHSCLEALGLAAKKKGIELTIEESRAVCDAASMQLLTAGKPGDARPLPPDAVFEGVALALAEAERAPLGPTAEYELGVAFDAEWNVVAWDDPSARFRLVFDVVDRGQSGDGEEELYETYRIADYKSGWPTKEAELDTIQMKAQAVAADIIAPPDCEMIEQTIVNLRTGARFSRQIMRGDECLAQWRREIEMVMAAADAPRLARIGPGCIGCRHVLRCDDAQRALADACIPADPEELARKAAAIEGARVRVLPLLRAALKDSEPLTVDGAQMGYVRSDKRKVDATGAKALAAAWVERGGDIDGLLTASKGLGMTQAAAIAKKLFPERTQKAEREAFLASITIVEPGVKFSLSAAADAAEEEVA